MHMQQWMGILAREIRIKQANLFIGFKYLIYGFCANEMLGSCKPFLFIPRSWMPSYNEASIIYPNILYDLEIKTKYSLCLNYGRQCRLRIWYFHFKHFHLNW